MARDKAVYRSIPWLLAHSIPTQAVQLCRMRQAHLRSGQMVVPTKQSLAEGVHRQSLLLCRPLVSTSYSQFLGSCGGWWDAMDAMQQEVMGSNGVQMDRTRWAEDKGSRRGPRPRCVCQPVGQSAELVWRAVSRPTRMLPRAIDAYADTTPEWRPRVT